MMHRAISRVFRGTCRKWRDDCPVAVGEDVRKKGEQNEHDFVPPKHSLEDAAVLTSGLVLAYQFTQRRRRTLIEECQPCAASVIGQTQLPQSLESSCPFSVASRVLSKPIFSGATALHVSRKCAVIPSTDRTPFIYDDLQETILPERLTPPSLIDDEDIIFEAELSASSVPPNVEKKFGAGATEHSSDAAILKDPAEYGRRYGADLLSVLGAFEFLQTENVTGNGIKTSETVKKKEVVATNNRKTKNKANSIKDAELDPPLHALELMKRGAELGSARALYNMGVAYDRLKDTELAKEYYRKAADLGHPLATYNCAVFALKDGRLTDGLALMKMASDFGVPEAAEFMKPSGDSLAVRSIVV
ncbi:unnamed protein product [Orchesella dallaii]|uniref:Death ligand signal enhancer n=1 Tax=Orchesella dallaii TaxID=48710 RepID=A0ABP1PLX7_9HEXA